MIEMVCAKPSKLHDLFWVSSVFSTSPYEMSRFRIIWSARSSSHNVDRLCNQGLNRSLSSQSTLLSWRNTSSWLNGWCWEHNQSCSCRKPGKHTHPCSSCFNLNSSNHVIHCKMCSSLIWSHTSKLGSSTITFDIDYVMGINASREHQWPKLLEWVVISRRNRL